MWRAACRLVKPRAVAVVLRLWGTASRASHVVVTSTGSTSNARQAAARNNDVFASVWKVLRRKRISVKPNSPMTMEGVPASTSIARRKTASSTVRPTRQAVPAQAGQSPSQTAWRPSSASRAGTSPKKSRAPNVGSPLKSRKASKVPVPRIRSRAHVRNAQRKKAPDGARVGARRISMTAFPCRGARPSPGGARPGLPRR